jgi:NTP pyrophosphatase (non-canonical NTP hydrolase)
MDAMNQLKFETLRKANLLRLPQFKNSLGLPAHSEPDGSDWSPADWMVAVVGELGEAANIMKKLRRGDFGTDKEAPAYVDAMKMLEKEFADFITYADIMASQFDIDLGKAVTDKFNEVSMRVGCEVFIIGRLNGVQEAVDLKVVQF